MTFDANSVRRLFGLGDADRAREAQSQAARSEALRAGASFERFLGVTRCRPVRGRVLLGRGVDLSGNFFWSGLPLEYLCRVHGAVSGATGSGKSFWTAGFLWQLLRSPARVIVLDCKSELVGMLQDNFYPALARSAAGRERLARVRVIRPFAGDALPFLRLTQPEPGVELEMQSLNLAAGIAESLGDEFGRRMNRILRPLVLLAIERRRPLPVLTRWLSEPGLLAREARASTHAVARDYVLREFPREPAASLDALRARLDELFFLPDLRLMLSAPEHAPLAESIEQGDVLIDLGSPPAGAEAASRLLGGLILGNLTRALLSRPVGPDTLPIVFALEEFQEILSRHQIEQFGRLLALARWRKISAWFVNQQAAQIAAFDPTLLRLLRTNTAVECIFRSSAEDARLFSQAVPLGFDAEPQANARARLAVEVAHLPRQEFLLWLKEHDFGPQRLTSPRLDLKAIKALHDSSASSVGMTPGAGGTLDREALARFAAEEAARWNESESLLPRLEDARRRHPRLG